MAFDWDTPLTFGGAWEGALTIGADQSFITPRTAETQTGNAFGSMTPIESGEKNNGWADWFKTTSQAVIGYAIAKDASRNNVTRPSEVAPYRPVSSSTTPQPNGLVMLALIAGAVLLAVKVAK